MNAENLTQGKQGSNSVLDFGFCIADWGFGNPRAKLFCEPENMDPSAAIKTEGLCSVSIS